MLRSLLKFIRLRILVTCYALAFLGSAVAGTINAKTLLTIVVIAVWYVHCASVNDYADQEIDKVNLENPVDRPLLSNDITVQKLWILHFTSGIVALLLATIYGMEGVVLTSGMLAISYLYSLKPFRMSDRGIIGLFLLAIAYVYFPFSLGYWSATHTVHNYPWLLSVSLYFAFIARLLLKDFRDIKGDKLYGKRTFLLRHGPRLTCITSGGFWLLAFGIVAQVVTFSPGVLVPLSIGLLQLTVLLWRLATTKTLSKRLQLIAVVARVANITILTLLAYFLCRKEVNVSTLEIQLIPAILGTVLLLSNWITYAGLSRLGHKHIA